MQPSYDSVPRNDADNQLPPPQSLEEFKEEMSRYIPQDIIDQCRLSNESLVMQPEDMVREDIENNPPISGGEDALANFWADLERSPVPKETSLALEAETSELGDVRVTVIPMEGLCQEAAHHYWHVVRGRGQLVLSLEFGGVPSEYSEYLVRCVLFRRDLAYRRFPVNKVCSQHEEECEAILREHVVQAGHEERDDAVYSSAMEGPRRSVSFPCSAPNTEGQIRRDVRLVFRCNSSCDTTETRDPSYHLREAAQDLLLVITLECRHNIGEPFRVLARSSLDVWPKRAMNNRDLSKPQRMLPKGGKAKKRNSEEDLDKFAKKLVSDAKKKSFSINQVIEALKNNW